MNENQGATKHEADGLFASPYGSQPQTGWLSYRHVRGADLLSDPTNVFNSQFQQQALKGKRGAGALGSYPNVDVPA